MSNEYKQCPNGHYYQGAQCPYCKTSGNNVESDTSKETLLYSSGNDQPSMETMAEMPRPVGGPIKTTVVGDGNVEAVSSPRMSRPSSHTVFGDESDAFSPSSGGAVGGRQGGFRETRKLVGWLVSYTLDSMGVDFKLYEGRNIIVRNPECNISVNDNMVSGQHAVLLFRAGKYSITDSQSSHGTFVNDRDIELEPCYLQDGDVICMGRTIFKFKTSF